VLPAHLQLTAGDRGIRHVLDANCAARPGPACRQ
jgi:hypothetical protein